MSALSAIGDVLEVFVGDDCSVGYVQAEEAHTSKTAIPCYSRCITPDRGSFL
jgi:hypothetical protein